MVAGEEPFTLEPVAVEQQGVVAVSLGEEIGWIFDGVNSSQEPSDNSCILLTEVPAEYIPWISIVFNGIPSTVNRVHKLDNKFFDSYSPNYKSVERVVGDYFGEPLYEYDLVYNHDGETNTFSIPSPIETYGIEWIEDAVLIGYDSDGYYQTTFRPFTNPNPNSNYDYEFDLYLDTSRSIYVGYGSDLWINIDQSASTSHKYQVLVKLRYTKPDSIPIVEV